MLNFSLLILIGLGTSLNFRFKEWTYKGLSFLLQEERFSDIAFINIYSSDEKDESGEYRDEFNVDGGLCSGSAKDAIEFML